MFAYVIKKKMETIIMMVESEIPISVTTNNYSIVESLVGIVLEMIIFLLCLNSLKTRICFVI